MRDHEERLKNFPRRIGDKITQDDAEASRFALRDIRRFSGSLEDALEEIDQLKKDVGRHKREISLLMMRNSALQDVIVKWLEGNALRVVETKEGS
jgi:hypothetical protein